jgi:hypothetical protein
MQNTKAKNQAYIIYRSYYNIPYLVRFDHRDNFLCMKSEVDTSLNQHRKLSVKNARVKRKPSQDDYGCCVLFVNTSFNDNSKLQ